MDIRPIDATLSASPQIAADDMIEIARLGFRSVVSNRPDGEEPGQPPALDIADAAKTLGLRFTHIPVVGGAIGDDEVTAFRKALDDLPGPILGFCRTGTRTTTLWALAQAGQQPVDAILATAATAGYDLSGLRARLEATG
ncbi:MAG TPA: TIGR01244 family sulfur transferase [Brevundimonas sp.]|jgi:uncharacterized protein (TIGR01244 family)|uniref:TIGR01244 family sulfur transferase n=1 Tax=Brevundimonas sp. TaxID=1871086 RepID=UPI002CB0E146|nr:TIGR01244 family sulfur transferase [Brevundimonas sp.]HRH21445.1 TIGR01244 family sulfur transferase [Brevundimonas sp.]